MKLILSFLLLFPVLLFSQFNVIQNYNLEQEGLASGDPFLGNGIVDLIVKDSIVWAATGFGLNKSTDQGQSWTSFSSADYIAKGGISAIGYMDDSTLWVAAAFDTSTREDDLPAGGGLAYTRDGGQTWTYIPQPLDSPDEQNYKPTTTKIQNLTFDIAFVDSTIWIASFGGGLRRSDDMGLTWQVVTTDGQPFSSLDFLNHRAFSLLNENGNLWYGSADGISKSSDNGQTWERFKSGDDFSISGNFVVALAYQEATNTIWAATIEAVDTSEVRAVSKTTNSGATWDTTLVGVFAHNFGFDGNTVFVAADEGLFVSDDNGESWFRIPEIVDSQTGEEILTEEYFSAASQNIDAATRWWFGSANGLATTTDRGNNWQVIRSFVSTRDRKDPKVYAYPSPFSPSRTGYTRFQYDIKNDTQVEVKIYNFAMEHVVTIRETENNFAAGADRSAKWDGKDKDGKTVATGVYFFRAKVGSKVSWGKVVVIN